MATIEALATADDYVAIYGQPSVDKASRLPALLLRATGYILSAFARSGINYVAGQDEVLDLNASTVCCAMANRALSAPSEMGGVSQLTQTAGSYSASVSYLDQYMRPLASELDLLGLGDGCVVVSARMSGCFEVADD